MNLQPPNWPMEKFPWKVATSGDKDVQAEPITAFTFQSHLICKGVKVYKGFDNIFWLFFELLFDMLHIHETGTLDFIKQSCALFKVIIVFIL